MSVPRYPEPPNPPERAVPLPAVVRWLLKGLAVLSLLLGLIGIFVPVMPTAPFILVSAWAAARSSPRLLAWLENHTSFGPMLSDWRRGGVVRRRAKWAATLVMSASAVFLLLKLPQRWTTLLAIGWMVCVLLWLWRRPEDFPDEAAPSDR